jgi:tRNA modification GTPase
VNDAAALLTPPGKGALAVLGLRGPRAWEAVEGLFTPRSGKLALEAGRWWLGRVGDQVADEAVLAVRRAGPSPLAELHVHGGREVARFLLDLLRARGVAEVGWEEFTRLEDPDAEALLALSRATSTRTAAILLDQYHGAFRREIGLARAGDMATLLALERRIPLGRRLTSPFRVVVAGAPNVGKSSLVNALAGYQRAVVSPTPGTTRDVVSTTVAIDGWPVELLDTAGLREGGEALEQAGIDQARRAMAEADLVLWVVEASGEPPGLPRREDRREEPAGSPPTRLVVNKIDLPPAWDLALGGDAPRVSAATGEGLDALCERLSRWLVPDPPPPGAAVPFTTAQVEEVRALRGCAPAGDLIR